MNQGSGLDLVLSELLKTVKSASPINPSLNQIAVDAADNDEDEQPDC